MLCTRYLEWNFWFPFPVSESTVPCAGPSSRPSYDTIASMGDLNQLVAEQQKLLKLAVAEKTHNTYQAAWNKFHVFCNEFQLSPSMPVSVQNLTLFIAYLSKCKCASSTALTYLSGISYMHKLLGVPDFTNCFIIMKWLMVWSGTLGFQLTSDYLLQLIA